MNNTQQIGRIGNDIEIRYTTSGKAVAEISLAITLGYGEQKRTMWMPVTLWGQTAETAHKYAKKGDMIAITGRLDEDEWNDKQTGAIRKKVKIVASEITLIGGKGESSQQKPQQQRTPEPPLDDDDDGDIPF